MRRVLILLIRGYQRLVSPLLRPSCRFHPSCSEYAVKAIEMNGAVIGAAQATKRLVKCGPWHPGGVDEPRRWRRAHVEVQRG